MTKTASPSASLLNKIIVVTGAAQGLGRAFAKTLAAEGARLVLIDINEQGLRETADELEIPADRILTVAADLTSQSQVRSTIDQILAWSGRIDVLVNNAIWARYEPLEAVTEETVDRMVAIGIKGLLWCTQAVMPSMIIQKSGSIINLSSVVALTGVAYSPVYSAIKGAVDGLTRAIAVEVGQHGVRINSIAPSAIPSPMSHRNLDAAGWEGRRKRTPLARIGTEQDIANAVVFLASDASSFVTGEVLRVDGGYCIGGAIPGVDIAQR